MKTVFFIIFSCFSLCAFAQRNFGFNLGALQSSYRSNAVDGYSYSQTSGNPYGFFLSISYKKDSNRFRYEIDYSERIGAASIGYDGNADFYHFDGKFYIGQIKFSGLPEFNFGKK